MPNSTLRLSIGAMIALGMAIVSVNAAEQTSFVNRDEPFVSETDAHLVNEREQLRRHFLEDWRGNGSYPAATGRCGRPC